MRSVTRFTLPLFALTLFTLGSGVYLHGYVASGHKWGTNTVVYYVNPQSIYVSTNAALSAIQQGASGWHNQSAANIDLVYGGTTSGSSLGVNNKNEVFFRNASNGSSIA